MRINNINTAVTTHKINNTNNNNNKPVNFNGFVAEKFINYIKLCSVNKAEKIINTRGPVYDAVLKERKFAESVIIALQKAMEKMHPATGLYREGNDCLVLRNKITDREIDIIRIADLCSYHSREENVRFGTLPWGRYGNPYYNEEADMNGWYHRIHGYVPRREWVGRSDNKRILRKDYLEIAKHIEEMASTYDKKLGADNISEAELQDFIKKEKPKNIPIKIFHPNICSIDYTQPIKNNSSVEVQQKNKLQEFFAKLFPKKEKSPREIYVDRVSWCREIFEDWDAETRFLD